MQNDNIVIHTDGACKGNPGPGGWGTVIEQNGNQQRLSGGERQTTNNRMEMTAVIKGLEAVDPAATVLISSDSTYVINTMTKGWKRKVNHDLWEQLDRLVKGRDVSWRWVRGHSGDRGNELADSLATKEAGTSK
jgi:ribonuclease HI